MNLLTFRQYTDEWWDARRGVPTASEAHRILTPAGKPLPESHQSYIDELIADLLNTEYGVSEHFQTPAMANGSAIEPRARAAYLFETGLTPIEVGFCLTDDGRFGCSPDALVGADGGLELKAPERHTQVRRKRQGVLPPEYKPQVHFSMVVTERDWWDFMSFHADIGTFHTRVYRDDYTDQMASAMDQFASVYDEARKPFSELIEQRQRLALAEAANEHEDADIPWT